MLIFVYAAVTACACSRSGLARYRRGDLRWIDVGGVRALMVLLGIGRQSGDITRGRPRMGIGVDYALLHHRVIITTCTWTPTCRPRRDMLVYSGSRRHADGLHARDWVATWRGSPISSFRPTWAFSGHSCSC